MHETIEVPETATNELTALVAAQISALLDSPRDADVVRSFYGREIQFLVIPKARGVYGKLNGRSGAYAMALRTLLIACARKHQVQVTYEIQDPNPERRRLFPPNLTSPK